MNMKAQLGFTLIELLVALAIVTIVLTAGVPSFVSLVRNNDSATEVNGLRSALNLARSEAVSRGVEVMIVPASGGDWTSGWLVGVDLDDDNNFPDAGEPVFRSFPAVDALTFTGAPARLEYKPTGEVNALASFTMTPKFCDNDHNRQRVLSVAMAGYVDLTQQSCP